uniref:CWH43-like N-terminal domain-containing protein n=1 Tax=Meloidogyne javanica TaxID=6303 RepID=A0A915LLY7_MELJA
MEQQQQNGTTKNIIAPHYYAYAASSSKTAISSPATSLSRHLHLHSLPSCPSSPRIPKNAKENQEIKEAANFVEDDNEDIAYLNIPLIWPIAGFSAFSFIFFVAAFAFMELIEHLSFERFALNQLLYTYGKTLGFCNNTIPYERGMWPSFLRQVELKVLSNVCFRVSVCVPMAVRIFVSFIIRNSYRDYQLVLSNPLMQWMNELSAPIAIVEVFSLGLFSIITIRFDYPYLHESMFGTFIFSSTMHMFVRTILTFCKDHLEQIDLCAGTGRLLCCLLYAWTSSQLFQTHQMFIHMPGCHGYVRPSEAITEYIAIFSYGFFSLLQLVDIRNVRFICYPRTCSGECEPLKAENFNVPGGKYQYCRAFEWVQTKDLKENEEENIVKNGKNFKNGEIKKQSSPIKICKNGKNTI